MRRAATKRRISRALMAAGGLTGAAMICGLMAAEAQEREPGSWVIIQGGPAPDENCASPVSLGEPDTTLEYADELCPGFQPETPPGLKFRLDLLPEIRAANIDQRRRQKMHETRRRALIQAALRPPLLSPNGDIPFTYNIAIDEGDLRDRYVSDQVKAQGSLDLAGYKLQGTLAEVSRARITGANRTAKLRAEAPFAIGPIKLRTGVDTYAVRDTRAGADATRIGRGIDARMSTSLTSNLDAEMSAKLEQTRDGGTKTTTTATGALHYAFDVADWQAKLSPGIEMARSVGPETPVSMAVRMHLAMSRGPERLAFTQRLYRQQISGMGDGTRNRESSFDYAYHWSKSSVTLRGVRKTSITKSGQSDEWQLGAVWTLKLEALAEYLP